jgi:quercetin dioxygenase-like cupin family protein
MKTLSRRSALALAAAATALPGQRAQAQAYSPTEGREVGPGLRVYDLSQNQSKVPGFRMVMMRDLVMQPGSKTPNNTMRMAMICHALEGELEITQEDGSFTAKKGTVWTCKVGGTEMAANKGNSVAVMRVIDLMT